MPINEFLFVFILFMSVFLTFNRIRLLKKRKEYPYDFY